MFEIINHNLIKMKKVLLLLLLSTSISYGQLGYWTAYNFNVKPGSEETVLNLFNQYFGSNDLPKGITVTLFENHFRDAEWNFSHQVLFNGSLDAMADQYSGLPSDKWLLFLEKVNRHTISHNSFMGEIDAAFASGDPSEFPIQRIYSLNVNDYGKWISSYEKLNSKYNKPDRLTFAGNFSAGHKYENGNAWVVNGFRDFKGAIGGHTKLPSKYSKQEHQKAYADFRENNGGVKPVRGFLRIMLATYTY
jgi:hypothetical protein